MPADKPNLGTLRAAVVLLAGQALGMVAATVWLGFADVRSSSQSATSAAALTGFAALLAVLFGGLAAALARLRSWARGPAIVLELLLVPIGYSMATSGLGWLGVVVLVLGIGGAALLLAPSTRAALGIE